MNFFINIISCFFPNKNKRLKVRKYLKKKSLYLYFLFNNRKINKSILQFVSGGIADQIRYYLLLRKMHNNNPKTPIYINISGFNLDIKKSFKEYSFDEIKHAFGTKNRLLIDGYFRNSFELHKYKLDWSYIKFLNLPQNIDDIIKSDVINLSREDIENNSYKIPFFGTGLSNVELDFMWDPENQNFIKDLEINIELDQKNKNKLEQIKNTKNSICIHIRRSDYIRHLGGKTISADYFRKSLIYITEKLNWDCATCFVFSDDKNWPKTEIDFKIPGKNINVDFVDINDVSASVSEIELQRACKHFILSVGLFGFLGFSASKNKDKIVVLPGQDDFIKLNTDNLNPANFM